MSDRLTQARTGSGKLRHKGYIIHREWADDGFGGQALTKETKTPCYISIIGSNGKESFQNDAIFNIKTLSVLVRRCDSKDVTEADTLILDGNEYNINNVELYERNLNYNLLYVSREIITGD